MILSHDDGVVARDPALQESLENSGYQRCLTPKSFLGSDRNQPCSFYISPQAQSAVVDNGGGYYTCPRCQQSNDLLHEMPWHGNPDEEASAATFAAGGGTRIGIPMEEQATIGENLIKNMGELPGYGPITWWHEGGAVGGPGQSPLDGATKDWGIEVKTLGYDAIHHRFVPGRPKEKEDKNEMARQMGFKGILGILVILDYRRSVADIFSKEFPLAQGVGAYRSHTAQQKLVAEVPFKNPLMDPTNPAPVGPTNQQGEEMEF